MKIDTNKILAFAHAIEGLKKIERFRGQFFWKDYPEHERYESVADHSWRTAVLLMVIEKELSQPFDLCKALKMAAIHDLPEVLVGDPSPLGTDGTGRDSHAYNADAARKKLEAEKKAAQALFGTLPSPIGEELHGLWLEFEEQKSFESKVVKAIDKIEAKIQANEYLRGHMFPEHLNFNLTYGVNAMNVDPAVKSFGEAVLEEFRRTYKEFTKPQ